jgi:hypothetical protein
MRSRILRIAPPAQIAFRRSGENYSLETCFIKDAKVQTGRCAFGNVDALLMLIPGYQGPPSVANKTAYPVFVAECTSLYA